MESLLKENIRLQKPVLLAETAAELMTPNPVSIRAFHTLQEAITLLSDKALSGVPVVDVEGHPTGVLSQTDLIRYDRESVTYVSPVHEYYEKIDLIQPSGEDFTKGFQLQNVNMTRVSEVMTPLVFSVQPHTSAIEVIEEMLKRKIHRLFVVDKNNLLVGVISAFDILKHIQP